jgi:protein SCO1/2
VRPRLFLGLVVTALMSLGAVLAAAFAMRGADSAEADRGAILSDPAAARFEGSLMPPDVPAPDFSLRDQDGRAIRMRALRGRPAVVTFTYANCDDSCPVQVQQVKGALDRLGTDLPALAIALEPERDTPAAARRFVDEQGMSGRLRFVLGSRPELRRLWRGYALQGQSASAEHQARIMLVDAEGRQRVSYFLSQASPERIAHDLEVLVAEARGSEA